MAEGVGLTFEVKVHRGRRITIPRAVADLLGIEEGSRLRLRVEGDRVVLEPVRDALWFAIHGPKVVYVGLEELEEGSESEQCKR
ncbi:MAG: looped-hinge helix DNA binding domain, AbrB family [uncultured Acidilobus sp. CIS]|jgi:looped-hinge helix DNA binding domain, AbrB family|nr:MAG: looped-hinge helix DNA binding domain, AbrB family [uncultured Acidilobus sp. CIS]